MYACSKRDGIAPWVLGQPHGCSTTPAISSGGAWPQGREISGMSKAFRQLILPPPLRLSARKRDGARGHSAFSFPNTESK